jgi:hypothetical protein
MFTEIIGKPIQDTIAPTKCVQECVFYCEASCYNGCVYYEYPLALVMREDRQINFSGVYYIE